MNRRQLLAGSLAVAGASAVPLPAVALAIDERFVLTPNEISSMLNKALENNLRDAFFALPADAKAEVQHRIEKFCGVLNKVTDGDFASAVVTAIDEERTDWDSTSLEVNVLWSYQGTRKISRAAVSRTGISFDQIRELSQAE